MNRNLIKFLAMFTMTLNHIAIVFMKTVSWQYNLFCGIGYFTGVVMISFLLDGYKYTRSRKKYFLRLFIFGVLSQFPYVFAFTNNGGRLNMMFSLCVCFVIIWALEELGSNVSKAVVIIISFILSFYCDWPLLAPVLTLLLYFGNKLPNKKPIFQGVFVVIFWLFQYLDGQGVYSVTTNLLYSMLNIVGVVMAFLVLNFCYSGKYKQNGKAFFKWFFYVFYPLHLMIIGIVERM